MTDWERDFIERHRVARLATVDARCRPHTVPVVYAFDGTALFTPLDGKPKRVDARELRRVRNLRANPHVAVLIDDYAEDWQQLAWVQIRGPAELLTTGPAYAQGIALLRTKYPQYGRLPLDGRPVIRIVPEVVRSWRAA